MTKRLTLGAVALALITALTLSFSSTQVVRAESEHGEHEVLESNMKVLGSAFRQLRRQARDKKFDDTTLKDLERMLKSAIIAMHANAEEHITKKEDVILYRTMMSDMIKKMLDTQIAVLKGDNDAAAACIDDLNTLMKNGHNKFKKD